MGFPVEVEDEGLVRMVEKRPDGTLVDEDGNIYVRTGNALVFKPTGDQLTLFDPPDELVLAGSETEAGEEAVVSDEADVEAEAVEEAPVEEATKEEVEADAEEAEEAA